MRFLAHTLLNEADEDIAYLKLDRAYRRLRGLRLGGEGVIMADQKPLRKEELPEGVEASMAAWEISGSVTFFIKAHHNTGFASREYSFLMSDGASGSTLITFCELPSRAIGNTVLRAAQDDAAALNNLAVLLYAEVANPGQYKESQVRSLLECAAKKGNPEAKRNLAVLRWNRGER